MSVNPPPAATLPRWDGSPGTEDEERTAGAASYLAVLDRLHRALRPRHYLEIGVRHGASIALAVDAATGVDPAPEIDRALPASTRILATTSDAFFASGSPDPPPDFCFIDGMHLFEYALRDFIDVERCAAPGAVVVFDDVFPNHPAQAERGRRTRAWTGDVWRIAETLRRHRPDLFLAEIDVHPAGMLLVAGLDAGNRRLPDLYRSLAPEPIPVLTPPQRVIERDGAFDPMTPAFDALVAALAEQRATKASARDMVRALSLISPRHGLDQTDPADRSTGHDPED